jgi:MerR family mercuric resistance operon transcriptional regulator
MRLRFIKAAQRLGFTLEEVAELLKLEDGTRCTEARVLAERRLRDVRERLANLRRVESALSQVVETCSARGTTKCPLIASLWQA